MGRRAGVRRGRGGVSRGKSFLLDEQIREAILSGEVEEKELNAEEG